MAETSRAESPCGGNRQGAGGDRGRQTGHGCGLDRHGDGWKLSIRIRLVHAQVRRLLLKSDEWYLALDGVPLHMAHMALGATGLSAITLESAHIMGVRLTEEERLGFMHIWQCTSWLLGPPEELLLFRTEEEALHLRKVAKLCEPPPGEKATAVAHGYLNVAPELLGITDPAKQKRTLGLLFRASRALMGNERADAFDFPKQSIFWILPLLRLRRRLGIIRSKIMPGATPHEVETVSGMFQRSVYDDIGISYRLPNAVKETESSYW